MKTRVTNLASNTCIHVGRGYVAALVISHREAGPQTVTLYDNTIVAGAVLFTTLVAPQSSPSVIRFPRHFPLRFQIGLAVEPGACHVLVTSVGN